MCVARTLLSPTHSFRVEWTLLTVNHILDTYLIVVSGHRFSGAV